MTSLVQLKHPDQGRAVAAVEGDQLRLLRHHETTYGLVHDALRHGQSLVEAVNADAGDKTLGYDRIYNGRDAWRILPAFDHPEEPARCHIAGTGLTHKASAMNREAMHKKAEDLSDSMRMYMWGVDGGRPEPGAIGVQPEWFYKGCGTILRGHNEPLDVPAIADDGGEEPEIVGVYLIDSEGNPRRVGMAMGNEFADHVMEKKNYLYLAPSKLRNCAIGPELVIDPDFGDVKGTVRIVRGSDDVWSKDIVSGEANMSHSLANLEHHQFKYDAHRRPGDVHLHFFGADAFSFGAGVSLEDGDIMEVAWHGYGRPLRNPVRIDSSEPTLVAVKPV